MIAFKQYAHLRSRQSLVSRVIFFSTLIPVNSMIRLPRLLKALHSEQTVLNGNCLSYQHCCRAQAAVESHRYFTCSAAGGTKVSYLPQLTFLLATQDSPWEANWKYISTHQDIELQPEVKKHSNCIFVCTYFRVGALLRQPGTERYIH